MRQKLWILQQLAIGFNENKSVRRLYDNNLCAPQWPDFQLPTDHGSDKHP